MNHGGIVSFIWGVAGKAYGADRDYGQNCSRANPFLWRYAGICRVQNIMRPYIEAMT